MTNSTGCNYDIGFGDTNDYYYYYDSVVRNSDISRQLIEAANTIRDTFELSHRNEEFT
jgi:replicative DNA helicase